MKMIVIGCGRIGAELAYRLYQKGNQVVVIDQRESAFQNLPMDFRGRLLEGHATSQDMLRRAGIQEADGVAVVTNSDTVNAVVAHIARSVYNVPSVVVRNYDSRYRAMHEVFGLQVVSSASWGAQRIEELLYQQTTRTVFSAGNGEVEIYEFSISEALAGRQLKDLTNGDTVPVAVTRAGRAVLPDATMRLEEGDVVLVSATLDGSESLRAKLRTQKEK